MKKTILYLSLVSTLTVPQGMGTEREDNPNLGSSNHRTQVEQDAREIARLQDELAGIRRESEKTGKLLDAATTQSRQIHEGTLPVNNGVQVLSGCQQQLLSRREQGGIGDKAWSILGGSNLPFAVALFRVIEEHPGRSVDIFYSSSTDFTLLVDGKVKDRIFKF